MLCMASICIKAPFHYSGFGWYLLYGGGYVVIVSLCVLLFALFMFFVFNPCFEMLSVVSTISFKKMRFYRMLTLLHLVRRFNPDSGH